METVDIREEVKRLVDKMPSNSTWDDVMHETYVRQAIESGLADSREGRVADVASVVRREDSASSYRRTGQLIGSAVIVGLATQCV